MMRADYGVSLAKRDVPLGDRIVTLADQLLIVDR
jgi:hypothetical protein